MKSKSENQSESESQDIVKSSNGETKNSKGKLKVLSLNVCGLVSKSKISGSSPLSKIRISRFLAF
jgi:hypothetical protein